MPPENIEVLADNIIHEINEIQGEEENTGITSICRKYRKTSHSSKDRVLKWKFRCGT
jgi:hypothetical protein